MSAEKKNSREMIMGISVCNPVDLDPAYFEHTIDYAIENKFGHIQFIGPIHNYIKGNIDGITPYRKYSRYNDDKDREYMEYNLEFLNKGCKKAYEAGIKMYMWHHELDLPDGFSADYPEILNSDLDIEVTHPLVKDFLENRVEDFFAAYPYMHGIVLTLHETKVPLLRLKNQKLDKVERVKYVTEILYNTCKRLGKELIVRPFASVPEDYDMMMNAYESISKDLVVMDKWTQFDWSLCLPHNQFFHKIKNNPLLVETDIFGEYFGKGRLPLMLRQHIMDKFAYCESFVPAGYCSRIDRGGQHPFGTVNEVNLSIMNACMKGLDVDETIDAFFEKMYPGCGKEIRAIMEETEQTLREIMWLSDYYFTELSAFPQLNHSKNHFYFEIMRDDYAIRSNEWFIPIGWERGSLESVLAEKEHAVRTADASYEALVAIKDKIEPAAYENLHLKFANLKFVAHLWNDLVYVFLHYTKYFETKDAAHETDFYAAIEKLLADNEAAYKALGDEFYCRNCAIHHTAEKLDFVKTFAEDVAESFRTEKKLTLELEKEDLIDFVVCGGGFEGHKLQKEVNFSDTFVKDGGIYRIPGTNRGTSWSTVNTHGWFSYELKVKPGTENKIALTLGTHLCQDVDIKITVDGKEYTVSEKTGGNTMEYVIPITPEKDAVRIRFDRFTANTPCVHTIRVMA